MPKEGGPVSQTVGQVAELANISVRTLHHYDEVGLLRPSGRSSAGYRRYSDADLERLQRILFYRELGFALDKIANILADGNAEAANHLRRQRELLVDRIKRLQEMVAAIEFEVEARQMGISLTPEERFEVFGDFRPEDYAEEVEERWGGSEAYRDSQRRTSSYTKQDWLRIRSESADLVERMAGVMRVGAAPESGDAMTLAEEHRQQITRWFYDCSYEIHRGLGDMYVADPRFAAHYERVEPGLAQFVKDAIHANADRAG